MTQDGEITVTAVVVGYNHAHCLGRCFDSLMGSEGLGELEVIYIDNASTDSSVAATSWHPRIKVVSNPANVGFARAVNQGLAMARGEFLALVNPDTALCPECLRVLADHLRQHPDVGLVGPILLSEEGKRQVSLARYPTPSGLVGRWLGRPAPPGRAWLVGAMVMGRSDVLRSVRGLDELYFVYGEDMDLSYRLQRRGLKVHLHEGVQITHTGNPRFSPERLVRIYGAYMRFAGQHLPGRRLPLGVMVSLLWLLRGRLGGLKGQGLTEGLRRIWSMERDRPPAERFY